MEAVCPHESRAVKRVEPVCSMGNSACGSHSILWGGIKGEGGHEGWWGQIMEGLVG